MEERARKYRKINDLDQLKKGFQARVRLSAPEVTESR
jgi:hypothetical protein